MSRNSLSALHLLLLWSQSTCSPGWSQRTSGNTALFINLAWSSARGLTSHTNLETIREDDRQAQERSREEEPAGEGCPGNPRGVREPSSGVRSWGLGGRPGSGKGARGGGREPGWVRGPEIWWGSGVRGETRVGETLGGLDSREVWMGPRVGCLQPQAAPPPWPPACPHCELRTSPSWTQRIQAFLVPVRKTSHSLSSFFLVSETHS